jgi:hypothetical protein
MLFASPAGRQVEAIMEGRIPRDGHPGARPFNTSTGIGMAQHPFAHLGCDLVLRRR